MSFFPDITPLIKETEKFNHNQQKIIALLEEIKKILQNQQK